MVHGAFLIESGCYPKIIQTGWSMENYGKLAWRTHMLGNLHMSPIAMATFGIFWCYDSPISPIFGQPISQIVCFPSDIRRSKWWTTRQQWWLVHLSSVQIQVFISVIWDSAPLTRRSQHCLWQHHDRKVAPLGLWTRSSALLFGVEMVSQFSKTPGRLGCFSAGNDHCVEAAVCLARGLMSGGNKVRENKHQWVV